MTTSTLTREVEHEIDDNGAFQLSAEQRIKVREYAASRGIAADRIEDWVDTFEECVEFAGILFGPEQVVRELNSVGITE